MAVTRISQAFKDISLSFDPHPVTKDLTIIKNENAIKRSIRNLVQTIPTERFFQPLIGSGVRESLFDFVDFGTASVIQKEIETVIENFEPRVKLRDVDVMADIDNHVFNVTIRYTIVGIDAPGQTLSFALEPTR